MDAALEDPPTTSEQVLFPPAVLAPGELRVEVPVPPADGEVVDDGVVGALFWFGLFTTDDAPVPPSRTPSPPIQGWGGDWAVTWQDGDAACVRIDVVGDTQEDTDELEDRDAGLGLGAARRRDHHRRRAACGSRAASPAPAPSPRRSRCLAMTSSP